MENKTKQLISMLDHSLCDVHMSIENIKNIQVELGRLDEDANDKYSRELQQYFLWDNHEKLNILSDYAFRVVKDLQKQYKHVEEIKNELFETAKVGEIESK